ncbi:tyrosine recombinase XerC [Sulfitobacter aestuarii]|uniref:Tyrosine recombinase XerC n=1 Tax=Sulfitobacter aestuarii TaxID=2161676 RepID=A0ABW5U8F8_9RHOB
MQTALLRFVHFLNRMGVAPDDVAADHALAYREALAANEISKNPDTSYRAAVNGWNLAIRRVPGWPETPIALPSRQKKIQLLPESLSPLFIVDLDALMARLGMCDPLSDGGRNRALRPATLKQYRRQLMRFASELVSSGVAPHEITSVAALLTPAMAERGLRQMLSRTDGKSSRQISEMAGLLRNIANILDLPEEMRKEVRELAGKVAHPKQTGMTEKNRTRLRVLQDPDHQLRLLLLPARIFSRETGKQKPYYAALAHEDALAIAILLVCPLRIGSLVRLELERHVQRPGDGRVYLVLAEEDTKTGRSIEFELPPAVVEMLDKHLATRVPHMCPAGTRYLFPQRTGHRAVDAAALAGRIKKRIWKETGLVVNAHLFRHFAVMLWLDANPGGYEVAARLLGHSELSHTIRLYSGMETRSATRAYAELIGRKMRGPR